jgi:TetR/AcrR family transcriptional regulator, regulator of cefoperazone and chloramphenicol sensitivity
MVDGYFSFDQISNKRLKSAFETVCSEYMSAAPSSDFQAQTREALLEAAAEVFAEAGFRGATVREICQRARANIAAVNYHFGDKEALYLEVLRHTQERAYKKFPPDHGVAPNSPAEEKLKAFIRSFLLRIFDEGECAHHGKMMSREMIEPTKALDALVQERIRPQASQLSNIVGELLNKSPLMRRFASAASAS